MPDGVKIVKLGSGTSAPPPPPKKTMHGATKKRNEPNHRNKQPKHGVLKGGKTARAKIQAVRDPARSPPSRKATLKILTETGAEKKRNQIRKTVRSMPTDKVRTLLKKAGYSVSPNAPEGVAREILAGGMEAGMIVSG